MINESRGLAEAPPRADAQAFDALVVLFKAGIHLDFCIKYLSIMLLLLVHHVTY